MTTTMPGEKRLIWLAKHYLKEQLRSLDVKPVSTIEINQTGACCGIERLSLLDTVMGVSK